MAAKPLQYKVFLSGVILIASYISRHFLLEIAMVTSPWAWETYNASLKNTTVEG